MLTREKPATAPPISGTSSGSLLPVDPRPIASAPVPTSPVHPHLLTDGSNRGKLEKRGPYYQRKRRPKAPKDSRTYKTVMATIALKAQGLKYAEIAEQLELSVNTIKTYLFRAEQKGWLNLDSFSDPEDKLDVVLRSKAVRNINALLDGDEDFKGDKETTLEVAKGLGMLKQHQVVKSDQQTTVGVALKVHVEMPPGLSSAGAAIRSGSIGGMPAFDAEVIEEE